MSVTPGQQFVDACDFVVGNTAENIGEPSSAHAAAIEGVGKAALDNLGAQLEGLAGDP